MLTTNQQTEKVILASQEDSASSLVNERIPLFGKAVKPPLFAESGTEGLIYLAKVVRK